MGHRDAKGRVVPGESSITTDLEEIHQVRFFFFQKITSLCPRSTLVKKEVALQKSKKVAKVDPKQKSMMAFIRNVDDVAASLPIEPEIVERERVVQVFF